MRHLRTLLRRRDFLTARGTPPRRLNPEARAERHALDWALDQLSIILPPTPPTRQDTTP